MNVRITISNQTVKGIQTRLIGAYNRGDKRLIRKISVLLEVIESDGDIERVSHKWQISAAIVYEWLRALIQDGVESLKYQRKGGRAPKLSRAQKKALCQWLDGDPQAAGFESGCWNSLLVQELIRREFKVLYNRNYVCQLLRQLDYTFQKAKFVSDHHDEHARQTWKSEVWPSILKRAKRRRAMILFGDEASFPQWGTLSYTWSRRGQQPKVKTSGIRKAYKVFGLIDYFSGRFFHKSITGKFNSVTYQSFLCDVMSKTAKHIFLVQDGARYHVSKAMQKFFRQHIKRITLCQLPSYSPDLNPIEYLWRNVKGEATHNKYFPGFDDLMVSVDKALAYFSKQRKLVKHLFDAYCFEEGFAAV